MRQQKNKRPKFAVRVLAVIAVSIILGTIMTLYFEALLVAVFLMPGAIAFFGGALSNGAKM